MRTTNTNIFFYFCLAMANLWIIVGFATDKDTMFMFFLWMCGATILMILDFIDSYRELEYLKKRLRHLQELKYLKKRLRYQHLDKNLNKMIREENK